MSMMHLPVWLWSGFTRQVIIRIYQFYLNQLHDEEWTYWHSYLSRRGDAIPLPEVLINDSITLLSISPMLHRYLNHDKGGRGYYIFLHVRQHLEQGPFQRWFVKRLTETGNEIPCPVPSSPASLRPPAPAYKNQISYKLGLLQRRAEFQQRPH